MERARVDISQDLDGNPVVYACFDLAPQQIAAAAHAVHTAAGERFRTTEMSADDVLEFRDLTALADELGDLTAAASTVVLRPARLSMLLDAVTRFVESRERADWVREEDHQPMGMLREMLFGLEQLSAEATRAALDPTNPGLRR